MKHKNIASEEKALFAPALCQRDTVSIQNLEEAQKTAEEQQCLFYCMEAELVKGI
jgi:hypothetical protein